MAGTNWSDYLQMLRKLTKTLEDLSEVERSKIQAVTVGDLPAVEQCMKQEQVFSLNLRGMDQKREKLLAQMDMKGVPLRNIMDHCPEGAEEETRQVADALRRQYSIFQSASEAARSALEIHLHMIEKLQQQSGGDPLAGSPHLQADFRA